MSSLLMYFVPHPSDGGETPACVTPNHVKPLVTKLLSDLSSLAIVSLPCDLAVIAVVWFVRTIQPSIHVQ